MPKLILTIGTSNSGKSTWASNYIANNPNTVELNRDMIRFSEYTGARSWREYSIFPCEDYVTKLLLNGFYNAIEDGYDVIVSDTNLSAITRSNWLLRAMGLGIEVEFVVMHSAFVELFSDPDKIMELPDYVLKKQYQNFKTFLSEEPSRLVKYTFV